MSHDLIIEVGTEEIPAGYLAPALTALEERSAKALNDAGLPFERIQTWCTPRRLALAVWQLKERQEDTVQEVTGPPVKAAYDANGSPTKAAEGFARGQGVSVTELITVETPKGPYLAIRKELKGRSAAEVLVEMLPPLILGLPFPKSMRWGKGEIVFVRPIHWLVAVFGGKVLDMSLGSIKAGNTSHGHRFLHTNPVEINSPDEYEEKLKAAQVLVRFDDRKQMVEQEIERVIKESDQALTLVPDPDLVDEVANLAELPAAILGRFNKRYLEMPSDIPITAMREHQRYFAVTDDQGNLAPHFVAINNTRVRDMSVVARGHERVLRARLDDARFYFKEDRKTPLEAKQEELQRVVFHTLLGTSWQKVERFTRLADHLADLLDPDAKPVLLRAASLCKCDLVTGVVGEFPALQGIMGREYALLDGEAPLTAQAIYEHYLPVRAGGDLPQSSAGALLSLADKIDTICGCFGVGLTPTGAADPFALRRQALGVINIILDRAYRISLADLIDFALEGLTEWLKKPVDEVKTEVMEFFRLRLKNQATGRGASTDGAEAVLVLHHDDLVGADARVWALEAIKQQADFNDLAVAFKRVVNIIKKFGQRDGFDPALAAAEQEKALFQAVKAVEEQAESLRLQDDFSGLLERIVSLKPEVDAFFDHVLVDDPDPGIKDNRLALLTRVSRLFDLVADFSKIST
jgi:glycyl-tRNA synthetase beta chain